MGRCCAAVSRLSNSRLQTCRHAVSCGADSIASKRPVAESVHPESTRPLMHICVALLTHQGCTAFGAAVDQAQGAPKRRLQHQLQVFLHNPQMPSASLATDMTHAYAAKGLPCIRFWRASTSSRLAGSWRGKPNVCPCRVTVNMQPDASRLLLDNMD